MLKERAMLKTGDLARWRYNFQKTWLSKIKVVVLILYYLVVPFV